MVHKWDTRHRRAAIRGRHVTPRKTIQGEIKIQAENGETRVLRSAPDWTESAINADHLWVSTSTSGSDLCYVGERDCSKTGPRLCCLACKVTAHTGCISTLIDKLKFHCKPTFKDGVRQCREQPYVKHHWVHRRHEKGRCKACGKTFQSKLSFGGNKEIVAISCSWCKSAYHNKNQCYTDHLLTAKCDFGKLAQIVVPPTWIVKLPRKGSFKSSIRRTPRNKRLSSKRRSKNKDQSNNLSSVISSQSGTTAGSNEKSNSPSSTSASNLTIASIGSNTCTSTSSSVILTSLQQDNGSEKALITSGQVRSSQPYNSTTLHQTHNGHPSMNHHYGHYYKHNQGEFFAANSSIASGGPNRRSNRRHSHATVSSLSSSLLSADSKDSYSHGNTATSTFLHNVHRSFAIKPIPSTDLKPLLVFINPKSGGNQGAKLIQKFQWHLNPRQVFDLSQGGPRLGLDLYKKVHNLRILACGGDGTAGWVMSTIDEIGIQPPPPISVLPLGTGNDLARSFNWGGSYTDEPVSKILLNIQDGEVVQLDRWNLHVQRNPDAKIRNDESKGAKPDLPLNVVNNYFSIGVDAHIALSFHEAREAHPERFNSRLRNRMFYGQAGGKDLLQRKWKDLCNFVFLECDGVDYTGRLRELKVHSVLFLNIPSYGGGTRPWAQSSNYEPQCTHDGKIEVIGLTTYQLPLLQAGGHGTCIAQCRSAKIVTTRTIPMQVDGEPCRLLPSLIHLELRNQANLIAKTKSSPQQTEMPTLEKINLKVRKLNLVDYETYHYDKERLRELSTLLGTIAIEQNLELTKVRTRINDLMKEKGLCVVGTPELGSLTIQAQLPNVTSTNNSSTTSPVKNSPTNVSLPSTSFNSPAYVSSSSMTNKFVSNDWCFVDSCTAERFFRIDRAQEHLHYVVDICNEDLYILDPQFEDKDEIDLLQTDDVIADFGSNVASGGDETDQGSQSYFAVDSDRPSDSPSVTSLLSSLTSEPASFSQLNGSSNNGKLSSSIETDPLPYQSLLGNKSDSLTPRTQPHLGNIDLGPNTLPISTIEQGSGFAFPSNHNDLTLLATPSNYSVDSPPRSPRRGQKPQSFALQDQLMSAAKVGNVSLLKQLHHKGVNLMMTDDKGMTALHYAVMKEHENAVSFLLNAFTPDMLDLADREQGHTALHKAVESGNRNICTMLAIRGSKLALKDNRGRTARDLAQELGQQDLAAMLTRK
ncbi:hypothetical protein RDWZM_005514 [Blomia tropicalis]|uniref:Diacylglycerol kinase n=1 Tax=Blomia tropicalis TaxID=40697 RepID=A0A9Q0M7X4_BLOTA|nr:hypothetical protein RDWZM_005514 [Blomia tropicalis]